MGNHKIVKEEQGNNKSLMKIREQLIRLFSLFIFQKKGGKIFESNVKF